MVHLARAVKDAQADEKYCYHCSSLEHFICNCPLVKTLREKGQLNGKEGTAMKKGAWALWQKPTHWRVPRWRLLRNKGPQQTPFLNLDPFQHWDGVENIAWVKINGESCMALLDNGAQSNTLMPKYVSDHSLQMGPITNLLGPKVACMGLGNAYMRPLGYIIIQAQVDRVQGYDEDLIALAVQDLSTFAAQILVILGTLTISCIINVWNKWR